MQRIFPILLSLAGCLLLFSQKSGSNPPLSESIQNLSVVGPVPATIAKEVVDARKQVLKQQDVLLKANELAKVELRQSTHEPFWAHGKDVNGSVLVKIENTERYLRFLRMLRSQKMAPFRKKA